MTVKISSFRDLRCKTSFALLSKRNPVLPRSYYLRERDKQMKTKLTLALLILNAMFSPEPVLASSRPCTPTRPLTPIRISCQNQGLSYSILIETLGSSLACPFDQHREKSTAFVKIQDSNQTPVDQFRIQDKFFEYSLGTPGLHNANFQSHRFNLDLSNCRTPAFGGLSGGN